MTDFSPKLVKWLPLKMSNFVYSFRPFLIETLAKATIFVYLNVKHTKYIVPNNQKVQGDVLIVQFYLEVGTKIFKMAFSKIQHVDLFILLYRK